MPVPIFFIRLTPGLVQDETFAEIIEDLKDVIGKVDRDELEAGHKEKFTAEYLPQLIEVIMNQQYEDIMC